MKTRVKNHGFTTESFNALSKTLQGVFNKNVYSKDWKDITFPEIRAVMFKRIIDSIM